MSNWVHEIDADLSAFRLDTPDDFYHFADQSVELNSAGRFSAVTVAGLSVSIVAQILRPVTAQDVLAAFR
ncbi:hypothetical protein [Pseudomonas guariconensis]|uniref:hypothetical protein n=1 Tax=Pseudomonas guariconensis TaxID=1288410 RepID=UPI0018D938CD|nr:hypothetical protein [Pseudomonas guariconensis]MBH3356700.1 hypothetical protein [Pseudomonas guariconensis]